MASGLLLSVRGLGGALSNDPLATGTARYRSKSHGDVGGRLRVVAVEDAAGLPRAARGTGAPTPPPRSGASVSGFGSQLPFSGESASADAGCQPGQVMAPPPGQPTANDRRIQRQERPSSLPLKRVTPMQLALQSPLVASPGFTSFPPALAPL